MAAMLIEEDGSWTMMTTDAPSLVEYQDRGAGDSSASNIL